MSVSVSGAFYRSEAGPHQIPVLIEPGGLLVSGTKIIMGLVQHFLHFLPQVLCRLLVRRRVNTVVQLVWIDAVIVEFLLTFQPLHAGVKARTYSSTWQSISSIPQMVCSSSTQSP